jgi:HAD superfamily hydrolase (TIGR01549 family)
MTDTKEICGLIFDCDGTLADTMPLHFMAWQNVLTGYGFSFDEDLFYSLGGQPTDRIVQDLSTAQQIEVEMLGEVKPIEPIVAIAHEFHGKLPMGVGSGGQREVVKQILQHLSLESIFDCVVGSEDTDRHKPEPDVFLEVARRLEVPAGCCRVYEDADLGVRRQNHFYSASGHRLTSTLQDFTFFFRLLDRRKILHADGSRHSR